MKLERHPRLIDDVTGGRVCPKCWADIPDYAPMSRVFCSDPCRNRMKAQRHRQRRYNA